MILSSYGKTLNLILDSEYKEELRKIREWIDANDLNSISLGIHEICGNDLYVNILQYETKSEQDCFWEAHKKYLDLHLIISGQESIGISNIENMKIGKYEEDKDYVHVVGDASELITCNTHSFLLLYPEDAHKTSIKVSESQTVKKCVFKIRIHN